MSILKKAAIAAVVVTAATAAAHAGAPVEPIMEPEIVVEESASSSAPGIIVPILFLAVLAVALM